MPSSISAPGMFFFVDFANTVLLLLVKNKHGTIPFL